MVEYLLFYIYIVLGYQCATTHDIRSKLIDVCRLSVGQSPYNMSSTTPLSNITNNSSNSLHAPRMNNIDLPDITTVSLMEGATSPYISWQDLHLWFEGIPEMSWMLPPPFQPTSNALSLELLANAAVQIETDNSPPQSYHHTSGAVCKPTTIW